MRTPELVCPGCVRVRLSCCEWSVEPAPVTASSSALRVFQKKKKKRRDRAISVCQRLGLACELGLSVLPLPIAPWACVRVCVFCVSSSARASPTKSVVKPKLFKLYSPHTAVQRRRSPKPLCLFVHGLLAPRTKSVTCTSLVAHYVVYAGALSERTKEYAASTQLLSTSKPNELI